MEMMFLSKTYRQKPLKKRLMHLTTQQFNAVHGKKNQTVADAC